MMVINIDPIVSIEAEPAEKNRYSICQENNQGCQYQNAVFLQEEKGLFLHNLFTDGPDHFEFHETRNKITLRVIDHPSCFVKQECIQF